MYPISRDQRFAGRLYHRARVPTKQVRSIVILAALLTCTTRIAEAPSLAAPMAAPKTKTSRARVRQDTCPTQVRE